MYILFQIQGYNYLQNVTTNSHLVLSHSTMLEEIEDTNGIIRNHKSRGKDRMAKRKRTNNDLQKYKMKVHMQFYIMTTDGK